MTLPELVLLKAFGQFGTGREPPDQSVSWKMPQLDLQVTESEATLPPSLCRRETP